MMNLKHFSHADGNFSWHCVLLFQQRISRDIVYCYSTTNNNRQCHEKFPSAWGKCLRSIILSIKENLEILFLHNLQHDNWRCNIVIRCTLTSWKDTFIHTYIIRRLNSMPDIYKFYVLVIFVIYWRWPDCGRNV